MDLYVQTNKLLTRVFFFSKNVHCNSWLYIYYSLTCALKTFISQTQRETTIFKLDASVSSTCRQRMIPSSLIPLSLWITPLFIFKIINRFCMNLIDLVDCAVVRAPIDKYSLWKKHIQYAEESHLAAGP